MSHDLFSKATSTVHIFVLGFFTSQVKIMIIVTCAFSAEERFSNGRGNMFVSGPPDRINISELSK